MNQALVFLISIIFDLYLWVVLLRIILQLVRADYYNPLSQVVIRLTDPVLRLLYKLLPYKRGIDFAAVALAFFVALVKAALLLVLFGLPVAPVHLLLIAVLDTIQQLLSLYFYILLIVAIASWFARQTFNPVLALLATIAAPVVRPIAKVVPPIAGLDFSPLIAMVIIKMVEIMIMQLTLGF